MAKKTTLVDDITSHQPGVKDRQSQVGGERYSADLLRQIVMGSESVDGPLDPSLLDPMVEYGVTGLRRMGWDVYEEFLPQLSGKKAIKVFQEMRENDPVINAICFAIEMLLRKVEWRVDAFSDSAEDEENAEFVRECMDDMSHTWADMIAEICSMLWFGFSTHEIVYKMRRGPKQKDPTLKSKYTDGKIGWRKIPVRSQDSHDGWEFDDEGGVKGWYQRAWPDFRRRYVAIEKGLLFRTTSAKNNPEGRSCIRGAYRPWYFKKRMEENEAIGMQRDLAGIPMVRLPSELFDSKDPVKQQTLRNWQKLVQQVRADEQAGIIMPSAYDENNNQLYEFSLLSSGGTRVFDTNAIIQRYDQRIAMVVLADFIFLGHEVQGSWALSTSKTGMFQSALSAWADNISEVFNRHAIPRLFDLNDMPLDRLPKIAHEEVDAPTLEELGTFIQAMAAAGWGDMLVDSDLRKMLLKRARLPIPEDSTSREKIDDTNNVLPPLTPGKENLIFAGPTGVVRVSPDGKADIQTAQPAAPPGGEEPTQPGKGAETKPQPRRRTPTQPATQAQKRPVQKTTRRPRFKVTMRA